MQLNPSEISDLIKSKIQNLQLAATARTEGTVVSVTDGICHPRGRSWFAQSSDCSVSFSFRLDETNADSSSPCGKPTYRHISYDIYWHLGQYSKRNSSARIFYKNGKYLYVSGKTV